MTKKIDLFHINVLGLSNILAQYADLEKKLKEVNALIEKHNVLINDYNTLVSNGATLTEKQAKAYESAKKALADLTAEQKKYASSFSSVSSELNKQTTSQQTLLNESKKAASERIQSDKALAAEIERSRKKQEAAAQKQSAAEAKLQQNLSIEVKSIEDLQKKNNALIAVRKRLDTTTTDGRREFDQLTKAIAANNIELKNLDAQIGNYQRNVGNYQSAFDGLFSSFAKGAIAVAALAKGVQYAIEIIGNETEGVEQAFARLNNPGALDELRQATKNTVSDLQLMKSAVQADNFKIPLDVLARGLQFAQQRAKDTGESVDYLVNSFVTGIGRKSVMILDNLGISATEIRDKLGDITTGTASVGEMADAVGKIIEEQMTKAGESTDLAAEKAGQLRTAWENLRDQSQKELSNFLSPIAEWGTSALKTISEYSSEIFNLIKAFGTLTAAVYAYIVAGKLKLLLSQNNRKATALETLTTYRLAKAEGTATASTHLLTAAKLLLTGQVKAATIAFRAFGAALMANPAGLVLAGITAITSAIMLFTENNVEASASVNDITTSVDEYISSVNNLNDKVDRYEKLQAKAKTETGLNSAEHTELNSIMQNLIQTVPGLKDEINEYSDVLLINSDVVKEYAEKQKENWKTVLENDLDALKERRKLLEEEAEGLSKTFSGEEEIVLTDISAVNEGLKQIENSMNQFSIESWKIVQRNIQAVNEEIGKVENALNGLFPDAQTSNRTVEAINNEISALQKEQKEVAATRNEWEKYQSRIKALEKERESITGGKTDNSADKRAKAIEENAKYIQKLLQANEDIELQLQADSIEKRLEQQRIGLERERQQAEAAYKEQEKNLKAAGLGAPEMVQAYEDQKTALTNKGESDRITLLKSYTIAQLQEYQTRLDNQTEIGKKEIQTVENIIREKEQKQLDNIRQTAQKETEAATKRAETERQIANATIADAEKLKQKLLQITLEENQAKYNILKKEIEARKAAGEQELEDSLNQLKTLYGEIERLTGELNQDKKRTSLLSSILGLDDENIDLIKQKAFQLATDINNTITDIQLQANQRWLENELERVNKAESAELNNLERSNNKKLISEETYERRKTEIENKADAEREKIERQAFEREKELKRKQVYIASALAVMQAYATLGPIAASISTGFIAAETLLQIAAINAQQFAGGGKAVESLPNGKVRVNNNIKPLSNGDNVLATVKRGEVILNKQQQKRLGGDATFRAIGVPGFAGGGKVGVFDRHFSAPIPDRRNYSTSGTFSNESKEIARVIGKAVDVKFQKTRFYVTETDIQNTTTTVKGNVNQSGLS